MAGLTSEDHRISRYAVFALFAIGIGCNGAELEVHDQQQAEPDGGVANADAEADPRDASHVSDPPRDSGATDAAPDAEVAPPDVGLPEMPNPCPNARVNIPLGVRLFIRPTPDTSGEAVGALYGSTVVKVVDTVEGEPIEGNTQWFQIESVAGDGFISAAFAECTFDPPQELAPPDGFYLPLPCDYTTTISQGNNGGFSHKGLYAYSWDFRVGIGTPLTAIADGIVLHTYAGTAPGSACDGGGASCQPYANHVVLLHGDNTTSTYRHLSRVDVEVGEFIPRATPVGLSGQTGYSTGPHAHVQRMENCGSAFPPDEAVCQSIPTSFRDHPTNGGVPQDEQQVTSGNCQPLR